MATVAEQLQKEYMIMNEPITDITALVTETLTRKIGRASCRERVENSVVAVSLKKKKASHKKHTNREIIQRQYVNK